MCELVGWPIGNSQDQQPFFVGPVADVAVAGLTLLEVAGPAVPAPVASILYILAVAMDACVALGTVLDGVVHFWELGEAGCAGSA